ncbi:MAG: C2H2-type zinc finger protein [Halobacteriaceae archaeon]
MSHDHDDAHECGKCGQTFDTESDLKDHARDAHDMDV